MFKQNCTGIDSLLVYFGAYVFNGFARLMMSSVCHSNAEDESSALTCSSAVSVERPIMKTKTYPVWTASPDFTNPAIIEMKSE